MKYSASGVVFLLLPEISSAAIDPETQNLMNIMWLTFCAMIVFFMQSAFAQSVETKDNVTDYLTGGRMEKGNDAVGSIISMEDSLRQMFELLPTIQNDANGEGYQDVTRAGELRTLQTTTENKQKKFQDLDKMIEELMLEHLQGDTDDNN